MDSQVPTIQFYEGISEQLSNVSLRRDRATGAKLAILIFEQLKSIEQFNSFRNRFSGSLQLIDDEGTISIEPAGVKFIFGGPEGDDLERVECTLEIDRDDYWERFMRFMHRYADANGMAYGDASPRGE
ncbi:photosystem II reaction center protein Psb28 [Almyronema epifaneia]|uniref:Photosystem II reaction center Psb28 protein n=1 Tax=Almyronema epifaneia S1 TaxID=2991925 RepID=A0ABW6IGR4_9CYAN